MGNFDRPKRTRKPVPIPERLRKLDRDLLVIRRLEFDYINLVDLDFRVRVCVMRDEDNKCWATAQFGDKAFRAGGGSASGAVIMLKIALRVHYAQQTEAKKAEIRSAHSMEKAVQTAKLNDPSCNLTDSQKKGDIHAR